MVKLDHHALKAHVDDLMLKTESVTELTVIIKKMERLIAYKNLNRTKCEIITNTP